MPLEPLSGNAHKHLRLKQGTYFFLENRPLIQLSLKEAVRAALDLPLAFVRGDNGLALAAILSFESGSSAHVGPKGGWLGSYLPTMVRAHPFSVEFSGEKMVFFIDTDSDWLSDAQGHALFDAAGNPTETLQHFIDLLKNNAPNPPAIARTLQILDDLELLTPWEALSTQLLHVDQELFGSLDADKLVNLRESGVLALVYAHLFSSIRLQKIKQLKKQKDSISAKVRASEEDLGFNLKNEDSFKF